MRATHIHRCCIYFALLFSLPAIAKNSIVIAGEEFIPYKYEENGVVKGIDVDIAHYLFEKLGVTHEFQILPWARNWEHVKKGKVDVSLATSKKLDREQYAYFPNNFVWTTKFIFFTNQQTKNFYDIKSYTDAKKYNLKIGIINGNSYHEAFWEAFPWQDEAKQVYNKQLEPARDAIINFEKLNYDRIQLYPLTSTVGFYTIKNLGLENVTYYPTVLFSKDYPNAFSKASTFSNTQYRNIVELMEAYDQALGEFKKTPEFNTIFEKYLSTLPSTLPH